MINKIVIFNGPDDKETVIEINPGSTIHILTDNGFKTVIYDANDLSEQAIKASNSKGDSILQTGFSYEK